MSQLVTQAQCESSVFDRWCKLMRIPPDEANRYQRKHWEWVFILQSLDAGSMITEGKRGLGFGVGREPIAPVLAHLGCMITASDLPLSPKAYAEWETTGQHASTLEHLNADGICEQSSFDQNVSFRPLDMRHIDSSLHDFDFLWSSCALEHLGSLEEGIRFIKASLECLRPGGIAVHTTEFNVTSNRLTLHRGGVVLYRRRDIENLASELRGAGHRVELNLSLGSGEADAFVDKPPYHGGQYHLKLLVGPFVTTSLGLLIRKASA